MEKKITVLAGDGIGPEVIQEGLKILSAIEQKFNHQFTLTHALLGAVAIDKTEDPFPPATLQACQQADAILLGAIGDPKYDNNPDAKVRPEQGLLTMRKQLNLFANIRPLQIYETLKTSSPLKNHLLDKVDLVIYRELTGGIYFGQKTLSEDKQTATDTCSYSVLEIQRIATLAFEAAQKRRNKLTLVDKANVLETSRLWRKTVAALAPQYPTVAVDYLFVDNAAMQLLLNPAQFDVILTENMFGDILSDEASVLSGSIGLLPSSSIGNKVALFEPIHGSYPQAKGLNIANPLATILSVAMLLDYFNLNQEAQLVRHAVTNALERKILSKDLVAQDAKFYTTSAIGDDIKNTILNS